MIKKLEKFATSSYFQLISLIIELCILISLIFVSYKLKVDKKILFDEEDDIIYVVSVDAVDALTEDGLKMFPDMYTTKIEKKDSGIWFKDLNGEGEHYFPFNENYSFTIYTLNKSDL